MSSKIFVILCVALTIGLCLFKGLSSHKKEDILTIGIIQTASHPALDEVREGFIHTLQASSNTPMRFVVQNAEGLQTQAHSIAAHFHAHTEIQAILAIGTPAVQAIAAVEKEKPIFIAAVSDPESLGILTTNKNICGTTDRVNTKAQTELVRALIPNIQSVALLYNPGETNSQSMITKMEREFQMQGISTARVGIHAEHELAAAIHSAARKHDACVIPADNLLASAMPLLVQETLKHRFPLIGSYPQCVKQGALAATGCNYQDLGIETAHIAHKILCKHQTPMQIGVVDPNHTDIVINQTTLSALKLPISQELLAKSSLVKTEGEHHVQ